MNFDEIGEFGVYDAPARVSRNELISKKPRKVFAENPIYLRLGLTNPLSRPLSLKNISLGCQLLVDGVEKENGVECEALSLQIPPHRSAELILKATPLMPGDLKIKSVEWELFDVVRCVKSLEVQPIGKKVNNMLNLKVVESSADCLFQVKFNP